MSTSAQAVSTRRLPPVHVLSVASMALIIVGGIIMAAHLPARPPLAAPVVLLVAAGGLLLASVIALTRLQKFDWGTFRVVGSWALLAYVVIAGMLEYVFVLDQTRGSVLVVLTLMLLVFAVDIPIVLAFSVARYQEPKRT
jgi:hypothetical protein